MNQVKAGAALNYVIIALNILTGLLYTPFMLRCLGQHEYGLYALVASIISYLTLLDFGFGSAIVRYTAKIRMRGKPDEEWSLYGMFLSCYAVIGLLVTIAGVVLYCNVDNMFDRTMTPSELSQARIMMALLVANLAVTFPTSVFGSIISAYEKFVFQRVVSIVRILLSTAVLVSVLLLGYRAVAMVVVQTVFSVGTIAANWWYCRYRLHIKVKFVNFDLSLLREILVFSWWSFLGAIVDRIYWSTGQFVLGAMCGTVAVAVFSLAVTLMAMYNMMSTSFNSVLLPRLTVLADKRENDAEISALFIRTGRLQFCVLMAILSGFIVFGRQFIELWAGSGYEMTYVITCMFFGVLLCPLIQNVGLSILMARGQQKFRSLVYVCIAAVSLMAQIWLASRYEALGCAIGVVGALFIGQWLVMNWYYARRQRIDIAAFWRQILGMAIVPVALTVIGCCVAGQVDITSWMALAGAIAVFLAVYLPMIWRFSMGRYERTQLSTLFGALTKKLSRG